MVRPKSLDPMTTHAVRLPESLTDWLEPFADKSGSGGLSYVIRDVLVWAKSQGYEPKTKDTEAA